MEKIVRQFTKTVFNKEYKQILKKGYWGEYSLDMELLRVYTEPKTIFDTDIDKFNWEDARCLELNEQGKAVEVLVSFEDVPMEVFVDFTFLVMKDWEMYQQEKEDYKKRESDLFGERTRSQSKVNQIAKDMKKIQIMHKELEKLEKEFGQLLLNLAD